MAVPSLLSPFPSLHPFFVSCLFNSQGMCHDQCSTTMTTPNDCFLLCIQLKIHAQLFSYIFADVEVQLHCKTSGCQCYGTSWRDSCPAQCGAFNLQTVVLWTMLLPVDSTRRTGQSDFLELVAILHPAQKSCNKVSLFTASFVRQDMC